VRSEQRTGEREMSFDVLVFIAVLIMSGLGALTSKYFFGETMLSMIMFFLFTLLYFTPIVILIWLLMD